MFPVSLGWNPQFDISHQKSASASQPLDRQPLGRIIQVHRGGVVLLTEFGQRRGSLTGKLLMASDDERPAVGDWVTWVALDDEEVVVIELLPRRNQLARVAAGTTARKQVLVANVDLALLAMAADADFNLSRLERYLAMTAQEHMQTAILLTKSDLCDALPELLAQVAQVAPSQPCIALSATSGAGFEELQSLLGPGITAVVLGSSGVGKSTMINHMLGTDAQATSSVRSSDARGRHTTTARSLLMLPGGAVIIDTPGLRELVPLATSEALARTFAEIDTLAFDCRFRDCAHHNEPGCAVRAAINSGALDERRLLNYHKLQRGAAHALARVDERQAWAQRSQNRQFGVISRQAQQFKRKLKG